MSAATGAVGARPAAPVRAGGARRSARAAREYLPAVLVVVGALVALGAARSARLQLRAFILPAPSAILAALDRRTGATCGSRSFRSAQATLVEAVGGFVIGDDGRRRRSRSWRPAGRGMRAVLLPLAVAAGRDPDHRLRAAVQQLVRPDSTRCRR